MEIRERAMDIRETAHRKRLEHKLQDTREDRDRLQTENHALQEENRRERGELDRALDAIERLSTSGKRPSRMRRVAVVAVAAGAAYVVGARAGRERFDQIAKWWSRARSQVLSSKQQIPAGDVESLDQGRVSGAA